LTKGQASYLIGQCQRHSRNEPATYRQTRRLRDAGYWRDGLTKGETSAIIGQLCAGDVA
jgi:hypothetical protein